MHILFPLEATTKEQVPQPVLSIGSTRALCISVLIPNGDGEKGFGGRAARVLFLTLLCVTARPPHRCSGLLCCNIRTVAASDSFVRTLERLWRHNGSFRRPDFGLLLLALNELLGRRAGPRLGRPATLR